jgi:hypothetical protein
MTQAISIDTRAKVKDALDLINEKLKAIEIISTSPLKTSGLFKWNGREEDPMYGNSPLIDINKLTNVSYLLSITGFLLTRHKEYDDAAKKLGLKAYPVFKWAGYEEDSWLNDIKIRISMIMQKDTLEKLQSQKTQLSQYISEDQRVEELLSGIYAD